MKYKVGDKVKVRNDLEVGQKYGNNTFVMSMLEYMGNTYTIMSCHGKNYCLKDVRDNNGYWYWSEEMLEDVVENKRYKVGDKVKVRNDLFVNEQYGNGVWFRNDMARYEGRVVTISKVEDDFYNIEEDKCRWSWVDEMFEDVSDDGNETQTVDKTRTVDVADNPKAFHDAFVEMIDFAKEHLSEEQFNELVYSIYTCGIENVYITEIPVYENVEWNGCVLWKRIKGMEYKIECKNFKDDKIKDYKIRGTK